jgi:hypothetical protein
LLLFLPGRLIRHAVNYRLTPPPSTLAPAYINNARGTCSLNFFIDIRHAAEALYTSQQQPQH